MKILILTLNIGKTAPGIVFEKITHSLSQHHQIDLITADYSPSSDLSHLNNLKISKKYNLHPRISKSLISFFNVDPSDWYWAWKTSSKIVEKDKKYDLIFSFLSSGNYAAIIAGAILSAKFNCKLAIHSTDAIPAPIGWVKYDLFYKGLKKLMANYLSLTDAYFTTNIQMLNYQLLTFKPKNNLITNVIYNPGLSQNKVFPISNTGTNNFLYTGGIYGVRKADNIINGFVRLLEIYPDSNLVFIGSHFSTISLSAYTSNTLKRINFIPYTRDLEPYYESATALIDIDADIDNDVFISSKMPIYLMINRIIISETSDCSPSKQLFEGIDSIFQCTHNSDQLCDAMIKAIKLKEKISFDDRIKKIELFKIENIISQLNCSLRKTIET